MPGLKCFFIMAVLMFSAPVSADPNFWKFEWPKTNFNKSSIEFIEILSGGPPKDGIPAIDHPVFSPLSEIDGLDAKEAVISVQINEEVKAYPLRILMWHEIVNDTVGGVPVSVTYCPLCNAAIVFDRRLEDGRVLDFGTTGKLRNSDLIMYDRQTESWWQQFMGEAIVGELTGTLLKIIPSRLESWSLFKDRYKNAEILVPNNPQMRDYGRNPYVGYSKASRPFLYRGDTPKGIAPMAAVLVIGKKAWSLDYIKSKVLVESDGLIIEWQAGQASALEGEMVFQGEDIGNLVVQRDGKDVAHHLTFAFAYHAFHPSREIVQ